MSREEVPLKDLVASVGWLRGMYSMGSQAYLVLNALYDCLVGYGAPHDFASRVMGLVPPEYDEGLRDGRVQKHRWCKGSECVYRRSFLYAGYELLYGWRIWLGLFRLSFRTLWVPVYKLFARPFLRRFRCRRKRHSWAVNAQICWVCGMTAKELAIQEYEDDCVGPA